MFANKVSFISCLSLAMLYMANAGLNLPSLPDLSAPATLASAQEIITKLEQEIENVKGTEYEAQLIDLIEELRTGAAALSEQINSFISNPLDLQKATENLTGLTKRAKEIYDKALALSQPNA